MCPSQYFLLNLSTVYIVLCILHRLSTLHFFLMFHVVACLTHHFIYFVGSLLAVNKNFKIVITVTVATPYFWIDGVNVTTWFLFPFIFRSTQQILSCICSPAVALEDQQHRSKHHLCHGGIIEVGLLPSWPSPTRNAAPCHRRKVPPWYCNTGNQEWKRRAMESAKTAEGQWLWCSCNMVGNKGWPAPCIWNDDAGPPGCCAWKYWILFADDRWAQQTNAPLRCEKQHW